VGPAASVVVVIAAFLPWTTSGTAVRNSFATVRSARLLGIGDAEVITTLLGLWYLVPALAGLALLSAVLGRFRLAGVISGVVGLAAVIASVAVARAPLEVGAGVVLARAAGLVALGAGLAALFPVRRDLTGEDSRPGGI
jgi:hypothetical protein